MVGADSLKAPMLESQLPLADALQSLGQDFDGPRQRCVVLRQATLDTFLAYLRIGTRSLGFDLVFDQGNFDGMMLDALHGALLRQDADWILVAPTLARFAPELTNVALPGSELLEHAAAIAERAQALIEAVRARSSAHILWLGLAAPDAPSLGLMEEAPDVIGQRRAIETANELIRKLVEDGGRGSFVSVEAVVRRIGSQNFHDGQRAYSIGSFCSVAGARDLAIEVRKHVRLRIGKTKKVLVLDCDNTLWGGLAGECDPYQLNLSSSSFPGAAFLQLQSVARGLASRGVLLALASKNDEQRVWSVFEQRQEMILSRDDISAVGINWAPKSENVKAIAKDLNIGIDAFVFVDDNPAEIEEVRMNCPGIDVLLLDNDNLINFGRVLQSHGWFEARAITSTDIARKNTYRANVARKKAVETAKSQEEYLQNLDMTLTVRRGKDIDTARVAQISQRTNQFNLSVVRYSQEEIEAAANEDRKTLMTFMVADRFGDLGDVGALILDHDDAKQETVMEALWLSCRAFGRNLEALILKVAASVAADLGHSRLSFRYVETERNGLVRSFLEESGATLQADEDGSPIYLGYYELSKLRLPDGLERLYSIDNSACLPGSLDQMTLTGGR